MPWVPKDTKEAAEKAAEKADAPAGEEGQKGGKGKKGSKAEGDAKGGSKGKSAGDSKGGKAAPKGGADSWGKSEPKGKGEGKSKSKGKGKEDDWGWGGGPGRYDQWGGGRGDGWGGHDSWGGGWDGGWGSGGGKGKRQEAWNEPSDDWPPKSESKGAGKKGDRDRSDPPWGPPKESSKGPPAGGKKGGKGGKGGGSRGRDDDDGDRPAKAERMNRSEDAKRQATVEKGKHTEVRKHSSMGCAVITIVNNPGMRQGILDLLGAETSIAGIKVKLKPHTDKDSKQEVPTDIFVGWGSQVEKATPLSESELADFFDSKFDELAAGGGVPKAAAKDPYSGIMTGAPAAGAPPQMPAPMGGFGHPAMGMPRPPLGQPGGMPGMTQGVQGARPPFGGVPPGPPGSHPGPGGMPQMGARPPYPQQQNAALLQAQAQWAAQMQAQYYLMQQQQHQHAMAYASAMAQQQRPPGAGGVPGGAGAGGSGGETLRPGQMKPAYRRPSDEEVKAKLQSIMRPPPPIKEAPVESEAAQPSTNA